MRKHAMTARFRWLETQLLQTLFSLLDEWSIYSWKWTLGKWTRTLRGDCNLLVGFKAKASSIAVQLRTTTATNNPKIPTPISFLEFWFKVRHAAKHAVVSGPIGNFNSGKSLWES